MRVRASSLVIVIGLLVGATQGARAQTWTALGSQPSLGVSNCLLLTDGTVICQSGAFWLKLTPSNTGSYVNGSWSAIASLPSGYVPDAYASAVLADGRALVVGGEYNNGSFVLTNRGAIYDPKANVWTTVTPPSNIPFIGDAPSCVLEDGRFLVGSKLDQQLAVLDPATMVWTTVSQTGKLDGFNSEEGWTLLPDGSIFTLDVKNAPFSERLLPLTDTWVSAGMTPVDLHTPPSEGPRTVAPGVVYTPPGEVGPTLLRPDGTVFAVGANGSTAIYTPPAASSTDPGAWTLGPSFPSGLNVEDGPAVVVPSGNVLTVASPGATGAGLRFFEFDGTRLNPVPTVSAAGSDASYFTDLLLLPTGQVLFVDSSRTVEIYTSVGSYNPSWAPTITTAPATVTSGGTYQIIGTQFNGLTQANAFGDETQNPTNYPLVRITNTASGHVVYARTHDHSSMGVATGSMPVATDFDVPGTMEAGPSTLVVVANGIPSSPVSLSVISTAPPTVTGVAPSAGTASGGTTITVSGTNFEAGAMLTLGGSAATVLSVMPTAITATTPAHAIGSVIVIVTNPDGKSGSLSSGYKYLTPAPTLSGLSPTSGVANGNTNVTLTGANFVSGLHVVFGGKSANVRSVTATQITVVTPSHASGPASVVVTNPDGQSATLANAFTYLGPAPQVSHVAPTSGPVAGGTIVSVGGNNFVTGATVLFGTTAARVTALTSSTITVTAPAHAAGTVSLTVTNPDGQSATRSNSYTFK